MKHRARAGRRWPSIPGVPQPLSEEEITSHERGDPLLDELLRLFLHLKAASWRVAAPAYVTPTQGAILFIVTTTRIPLGSADIARLLGCSRPNVSRSVANLEQKGFVRREPDPLDRRRVVIRFGRPGRRVAGWFRSWDDDVEGAIELLTTRQRAALGEELEAVLTHLRWTARRRR